ncbi:flagellar hook protein FlgE [Pluralibacter gergoviae]|uniref:Flagellar hook protein FlgE n=1 Tax=Pluralibacter gergoviae TaxID=61647 RepID=A0AAI9DMA5_PLUGE|nr:flagellar hook protein FlgE [Pluralibacter gergoviae]AIQ99718.1 flagellar biosynthesis protein FlgE [Pluralibacter gergoviae]EKT9640845.1 flagellar hook protein FlgE [Pluralibacter gergoviae]EKV0916154.1 flagellar hook protein FlgE [Pluralibacter gergoviae]EKV0931908.1 flagellar hook protein FlgE [Pluralibacter gergoviae]EKV3541541.1 flagellar hook protein FlgE [Pluralibacter gergoviae]
MSFAQGLSGLNAASQALDVVGNNIANSQTVGFKSGAISFADVFAGSQVGMGVQVAGVNQDFTDGVLTQSNNALDMGIQGNGFFRMVDEAGRVFYSRNGQFQKDASGYIINNQGMKLSGYQATGTPPTVQPGSPVGPIQIPDGQMPAKASDAGTMSGNLSSETEAIDQTEHPFDPSDNKTYSQVAPIEAYDSLGNKHTINVYYVKTGDNQWKVYTNDTTSPVKDANGKDTYGELDLQFDSSGKLTTNPAKVKIQGASYNGGTALDFDLDLDGTIQQSSETSIDKKSTTGYAPGQMNGYTVDDDGQVMASYSNGQSQLIGQVVLANFTNPGGLSSEGNNCWSETSQSGQPVIGSSGTGNLGTVAGNRVEASNVDLSQEMVNMIVYQRNYQSNSQTIKTQSELLQIVTNLG